MPYFRIILKLEKKQIETYITEFPDKDIDSVYSMFERRINEKYGAGRVEYFNCVMVAKKTIEKLPVHPEIKPVPKDDYGLDDPMPDLKWQGKKRKGFEGGTTLGERKKPL